MRALLRAACAWPFLPFVILLVDLCAWSPAEGAPPSDSHWFVNSKNNEGAVLGYMRPALKSAGKAGRVYFRAYCPPGDTDPVVFPKVHIVPAPKGSSGLAAVQGMFRHNKYISVTEDAGGIIRVKIGRVSEFVLRTPIPKLAFDPESQYTDLFAIYAIERATEVKSAMDTLKIRLPNRPTIAGINPPDEKLPHLPAVISNVTMDQALDEVARTFHTIVLYGTCVNSNLYEIRTTGRF
jgi:hypothetical protein